MASACASAGAITDRYAYDVFGAMRSQGGTTANDFRYTGQQPLVSRPWVGFTGRAVVSNPCSCQTELVLIRHGCPSSMPQSRNQNNKRFTTRIWFVWLIIPAAVAIAMAAAYLRLDSGGPRGYLPQAMQVIRSEQRARTDATDQASLSRAYTDEARDWGEITPPAGLASVHLQVGQALATAAAEVKAIDTSTQTTPTGAAAIWSNVLRGPLNAWSSAVERELDVIPVVAWGTSMKPTLCSGDIVYFTPFRGEAARWEIVSVNTSIGGLVKRIIGMPGETIRISQGQIYIDSEPLGPDRYELEPPKYSIPDTKLGPDQYFVLGDNRNNSYDSTDPRIGPVRKSDIDGTAPQDLRGCN